MPTVQTITPCLWFDSQAQEAATFYTSVFKNSRITQVSYYGVSWQIVPRAIGELMRADEPARANRVMAAMMGMKKIDLAALQAAFNATP